MGRDPVTVIPVVYMGGCCGDLVASLIDWKDSRFDIWGNKMRLPADRQRLKKPHLFQTDEQKHDYMQWIKHRYDSVPSHDLDYHVRNQHWFIGIAVDDSDLALWAAQRFKDLHRAKVWKEVEKVLGITTWQQYAQSMLDYSVLLKSKTSNILQLEDILSGHVIPRLESMLGHELPITVKTNAYRNWQDVVHRRFIL